MRNLMVQFLKFPYFICKMFYGNTEYIIIFNNSTNMHKQHKLETSIQRLSKERVGRRSTPGGDPPDASGRQNNCFKGGGCAKLSVLLFPRFRATGPGNTAPEDVWDNSLVWSFNLLQLQTTKVDPCSTWNTHEVPSTLFFILKFLGVYFSIFKSSPWASQTHVTPLLQCNFSPSSIMVKSFVMLRFKLINYLYLS